MRKGSDDEADGAAFNPITLTLAVRLGLIVGVTGLIQISEHAANQAAAARTVAGTPDGNVQTLSFAIAGGS